MIEIKGSQCNPVIYADGMDSESWKQVINISNTSKFSRERVRIMPDVHAGKGCVIGFTSTINDITSVSPDLVGVDIGCGVYGINFRCSDLKSRFPEFDARVRNEIKHGNSVNDSIDSIFAQSKLAKRMKEACEWSGSLDKYERDLASFGTLGGGNHFIEIDECKDGSYVLLVHSGSRNFGHRVATFWSKICSYQENGIKFLSTWEAMSYINHQKIAVEFAAVNRINITMRLLSMLKINSNERMWRVDSVHNFFDDYYRIVRKGATSANKDEELFIPLNMGRGTILAVGKGNIEWNRSAPHGAGRTMSRSQAKVSISIDKFSESMKNVYTSCISDKTLDESPQAYKDFGTDKEITEMLEPTAEVVEIMKPVYNFKSF